MLTPRSLDILFLTNFTDNCSRSIPAIAQMADSLKVRLTVMHAYDPARSNQTDADERLNSFFPETGRYAACRRVAVPGPLIDAARRHLEAWPVNLIVAPASDPTRLPRIGQPSMRSRLIKECGVPVWTISHRVQMQRLTQPVRNVACWLDFYSLRASHLAYAVEYANKLNAKLHLLRALPEIHEGSLHIGASGQDKSLCPDGAIDEILRLCANAPICPEVHVSCGEGRSSRARMLRDCDADIVFLQEEEPLLPNWLGFWLRLSDRIPCPAVYIRESLSAPVWNFETGIVSRSTSTARGGARLGGQLATARTTHNGDGLAAASKLAERGIT